MHTYTRSEAISQCVAKSLIECVIMFEGIITVVCGWKLGNDFGFLVEEHFLQDLRINI